MNVGSLFSGVGLLDYGLHLAGLEHRWFCEADEFRRSILRKRWPGRPVYDDVRSVGGDCERVDVVAGGFPCKGASSAGKRTGFGHPETVLWRQMARSVRELRPRYVVVENVADLIGLHGGDCFSEVLGDLAACGFDVWWDCIPAAAFGAAHLRDRVVVIAAHPARLSEGRPRAEPGADRERAGAVVDAAASHSNGARADAHTAPGRSRQAAGERACAAADSDAFRLRPGSDVGYRASRKHHCGDESARGVPIDWGVYRPAVERWEAVHGPAPLPLVRRVDDGRASRVERSRLSALGDGVQVQLGWLVGRMLMEHRARFPDLPQAAASQAAARTPKSFPGSSKGGA